MPDPTRRPKKVAPPRKKACLPCSNAKVRCDQKRSGCTHCTKRGIRDQCIYPTDPGGDQSLDSTLESGIESTSVPADGSYLSNLLTPSRTTAIDLPSRANSTTERTGLFLNSRDSPTASIRLPSNARISSGPPPAIRTVHVTARADQVLSFDNLDLVCTIDPEEIRNRWLKPYVPSPNQTLKNYPANITAFVSRILKAYSLAPVQDGSLPSFIHFSQQTISTISSPLANFLSLARMCDRPLLGSQSVIQDTIRREMDRLYTEYKGYEELELLAAFQAYLMYAIIIYFNFDQNRGSDLHQVIINLQDVACELSRRGLVSAAELNNSRPSWESWIVAEAKRRTLFTMYLFDSVLCARDGLPTFLGTELQGTPAPAAKLLWQATDRDSWALQYNRHLNDWGNGGALRIEELWPIPDGISEPDLEIRRGRVDRWATSLDEFGTMLFAVTSCTHGG